MVDVKHFHWADYLVFGIFLTVSAGIGFFFGWRDRKKTSVKEFLTGGKKMHWIPVALSMQASFLSAIFILSTPVEFYYFGTTYYYLFLTYIVALPISAHMFLSVFYKMNLLSAYEYLEVRFNKPVRIAGASTFCLMMILYMPVVLYTPAIALAQVTGLPINISILLCGSICTLYTFLGGMKATVWNDFLQMVVIIAGLFCIIIIGTLRLGGIKRVWEINEEGGRIILNDFRIDPTIRTTFWTQFVGGSYVSFSLYTSSQTIIQKFLSVRSLKDAYKSIYLDTFTSFLFITLVALVGILCYAFYATCDPLSANRITKSDQLVPLLVMEVLSPYPGLPGLFIATTFSAALSSLSGGLNAMSAVAMTDFICPLYNWLRGEQMTERFKTILSKALVFGFGVFSIGSGYVAQFLGDSILQISISIFGFVGGPLTALLVLGICFPFVNCWGAISGLVMSLTISSWMAVGSILSKVPLPKLPVSVDGCLSDNFTTFTFPLSNGTVSMSPPGNEVPWFYRISHFYYAPISLVIALVVAIPVSLITGHAKNTEPELIVDWGNICFRKRQKPTMTENKIEPFGQVRSKDSKSDFENSAYFGDNEIADENYLKNRKLIYSTKL